MKLLNYLSPEEKVQYNHLLSRAKEEQINALTSIILATLPELTIQQADKLTSALLTEGYDKV